MFFWASGFTEYEGTTCTQIRCLSAHSFHGIVMLEVETGAPKRVTDVPGHPHTTRLVAKGPGPSERISRSLVVHARVYRLHILMCQLCRLIMRLEWSPWNRPRIGGIKTR